LNCIGAKAAQVEVAVVSGMFWFAFETGAQVAPDDIADWFVAPAKLLFWLSAFYTAKVLTTVCELDVNIH
jgi:hypothetical protein